MYYVFFIHLSVDGHLGCFHISAIVNNSVMNIGVQVSFQISVFVYFRYISRRGIAWSQGVLFLIFWESSALFPTVDVVIYIPTYNIWGFPFLHMLLWALTFITIDWQGLVLSCRSYIKNLWLISLRTLRCLFTNPNHVLSGTENSFYR